MEQYPLEPVSSASTFASISSSSTAGSHPSSVYFTASEPTPPTSSRFSLSRLGRKARGKQKATTPGSNTPSVRLEAAATHPSEPSTTLSRHRARKQSWSPGTSGFLPPHPTQIPVEFDTPQPRTYRIGVDTMPGGVPTQYEIEQYIHSLNTHRVNTIVELRRIEKVFAQISGPKAAEVTQPMTAAWMYYVNSHALLTELRGLTRNYPFNAECIEEAKRRVYSDPESNRSWNLCWLVLSKIQNDHLISAYARSQASQPAMWGNRIPTAEGVTQLSTAFVNEWTWALNQMLRHWEVPPRR